MFPSNPESLLRMCLDLNLLDRTDLSRKNCGAISLSREKHFRCTQNSSSQALTHSDMKSYSFRTVLSAVKTNQRSHFGCHLFNRAFLHGTSTRPKPQGYAASLLPTDAQRTAS